jgi:hypothetical protein
MGRKKKKAHRTRDNSPLSAHKREGTRVLPPMLQVPNLQLTNWLRDIFPDMLWLCSTLAKDVGAGLHVCARTLDAIDAAVEKVCGRPNGRPICASGALTDFEAIPHEARQQVLDDLQGASLYEVAFPLDFAHALGMYPQGPGGWVLEPWRTRGVSIDPAAAEALLSDVVTQSFNGQSLLATRAKFLYLRSFFKAGRVVLTVRDTGIELYPKYPDRITEEERQIVEPTIRAQFGAIIRVGGQSAAREAWARTFWRSNWRLYVCKLPRAADEGLGTAGEQRAKVDDAIQTFRAAATNLQREFEATVRPVDPDLYAPDRYEVLTGITARVLRLVRISAGNPILWTGEYGSHVLRSVVEGRIVLKWLEHKSDSSLYTKFKQYGRGRLKLLKLHVEEYLDSLSDPPEPLRKFAEDLDAEVNADTWEEFQEISVDKTFSSVTIRQMAIDVGLKREYDFAYAPASGEAHGDWIALDRSALVRCRNPLHMWHRIPNTDYGVVLQTSLIGMAVQMAASLLEDYSAAVTT